MKSSAATIKFDSDEPHKCDYCNRPVVKSDNAIIIGTRTVLLIYHQECDQLSRAERAHLYTQFLREQEALQPRKESL